MHLQQTKVASLRSGGPQYYFHDVPDHVKEFLRKRGVCPVVLRTPYGIANSSFTAVGRDHKLSGDGIAIKGGVGHDRIQGKESIGEAIRRWYDLPAGQVFERIDLEAEIHKDGHFILVPTAVRMRGAKRSRTLEKVAAPLSFHKDYQSKFWRKQIDTCRNDAREHVSWAGLQIRRVVKEHGKVKVGNVHEADLLRVAGALSIFGVDVGIYRTKGYDCAESQFKFLGFPSYPCPVEIKKRSSRFNYQIKRYTNLPRAVVLCIKHDFVNPPEHVDILELPALADYICR